MKKIVLTGSSGFIGSYFTVCYQERYEIRTFSFIKEQLEVLELEGVECVVHLAALVHQMGGAAEEAYRLANVENTVQLALKAKEAGVGQFVFMSTVKVYGEENPSAYTEQTPCHPSDAYGRSKLEAEKALLELETETFKIAIIRTPVVYGEEVKANIYALMALVQRRTILPFRNIKNRRSMVYIGNLVHLLNEVIRQECAGIFLAGDDKPISTSGFVATIADAMHKNVVLLPCPLLRLLLKYVKNGLYRRLYMDLYVDNHRTKEQLRLQNPYTTQEGITKMVQWYKDEVRA